MKTINKFFVMLVLLIGASSPEIKAQTQNLSPASWIKWYKPNPKDPNKNVRIYRVGTAQEMSQIATNVKNNKIVGDKVYELPGTSNVRFALTQPELWYEYELMSYRSTDQTVTRENLPEVMAKSSLFIWDNNFAGKTVNNYYYSQTTKTVQFIPNYSGLSAGVPIFVHTDGTIKGKADCFNPAFENVVKTGSTKKDTVFIVKNTIQQQETETEITEKPCVITLHKKRLIRTEQRDFFIPGERGDFQGNRGMDGYWVKRSFPIYEDYTIEVPCEEYYASRSRSEEEVYEEKTVVREKRPIIINAGVAVTVLKRVAQATETQQDVFTPVTPGKQGGAFTPVTPGKQGGAFIPVTPGGLR
jgi:hypothetical protein